MYVLETLMPIFILVGLGAFMRRINFLSEDFFKGINKLTFYVGLPILLFHKIALAKFAVGDAGKILLVMTFAMTVVIPIGYILALLLRLQKSSIGTFVQSCFRCNMTYVGLPVVLYTFSGREDYAGQLATLSLAPLIPYTNIISIIILARSNKTKEHSFMPLIWKSLTTPVVLACLAALPFSIFSVVLPKIIDRSFQALGNMALPLALLSIGSSLTFEKIKGNLPIAITASLVNVIILPVLGLLLSLFLNMNNMEIMIALILLACPAASSSYIMVQQLGGDEALAGSSIVISTLMSIIPLSIIVAYFG